MRAGAEAADAGDAARFTDELISTLASLSFPAFAACMRELLRAMGYRDVTLPAARLRAARRLGGGRDGEAWAHTGLSHALVAVQLKQYRRPVPRRFVDELRGAAVRTGAREGLIITTSTFSRAARRAAHAGSPPSVRLVDRHILAALCALHGIGARCQPDGLPVFDSAFFHSLTVRYPRKASAPALSERSMASAVRFPTNPLTLPKGDEMTARTHVLAGLASLWLLRLAPGPLTPFDAVPALGAAAIGALLPDLDTDGSKAASVSVFGLRPFAFAPALLRHAGGHRGLLHSLLALLLLGAACRVLARWIVPPAAFALWMGYAAHLLADACTRGGIPLLFPRRTRFHLLPAPLRITTGSLAEEVLALFLLAAVVTLFVRLFPFVQTVS